MTIRLFEVGGCVRDELMFGSGARSKDVDFAVEAPSFEAMEEHIQGMGLRIFLSKPEFLTIRAGVPKGHQLRQRCRDADFVLCRKDGPTADGRRPQFVEPGTIEDDLARRDFTVNAIARDPFSGELIDPHGGQKDIRERRLKFVGDPQERIAEDGLRVMRGLRFMVTKGLAPAIPTMDAIFFCENSAEMLHRVSIERVREELEKMMAHDSLRSMKLLMELRFETRQAIFREGLRLSATLKR